MTASTFAPSNMPAEPTDPLADLKLSDVNCFDIWDRRECAVANSHLWKTRCQQHKQSSHFADGIPLKMHQVWIGSRQPPCVWLDTWRIDFMTKFQKATTDQKEWQYILWDNDSVQQMPMLNRELFDAESKPQCQADILRLEVLYEYGGVYIDADIVSTVRDLRPALAAARETGFMITYEPDTKDKPYSILGNSIIACTPRHPLILMLMSYIKHIYPIKRPFYGVEWVTGPLTYTKVLVDTGMPITVPSQKDFYPAFHYVPNPSTIDVTKFDSYCFQFGYTCSGLSQWVADNNNCRKAHDCSYHARQPYPLGTLRPFPQKLPSLAEDAAIPRTIHQFAFQSSSSQPTRWIESWRDNFCVRSGFSHELWTWSRLRDELGSFFCAHLYSESNIDSFSVYMLALEVLHARGGYFVPLATPLIGEEVSAEVVFGNGVGVFKCGSLLGLPQEGALTMLKAAYDAGSIPEFDSVDSFPLSAVSHMTLSDAVTATADFKPGSRFLGAGSIYYLPPATTATSHAGSAAAALSWAYDCQVPLLAPKNAEQCVEAVQERQQRAVVISDAQFGMFSSLVNELPGVMYRLDSDNVEWDFIVVNVEWEADEDGFCEYRAVCSERAPNAKYLGFIVNAHTAASISSVSIDDILGQHGSGKVFVASEKSKHGSHLAAIFRSMPAIEHACRTEADFVPNFDRDVDEYHDNLFKGFRNGQISFEMQVDDEQRVMYRSWGDDGSVNCECKITAGVSGLQVEWLRVYAEQKVVKEVTGHFVR